MSTATKVQRFDVRRMEEDMALRGWLRADLARAADVDPMTVIRFFRGDFQTNKTAKKLALAMGYTVRRYLLSIREGRVAS